MSKTLTIMFEDLNNNAQKEVLKFYGYDSQEKETLMWCRYLSWKKRMKIERS